MATYDAPFHLEAFEQMEARRKTVYALPALPDYAGIVAGDRLEFGTFGSITVGMVRRYPSLEALVEAEGWANLVPEASGPEEAVAMVRAIPEWDRAVEEARGVLSLRVREARRKG